LCRARTGVAWRDLPGEFGDWNAVYQGAKRWRRAGTWDLLFAALPADSPVQPGKRLFADSTTVRARTYAAGAEKVSEAREALSHSWGGSTTKIHLAATDHDTAVAALLMPSQAGEAPTFDTLFAEATAGVAYHAVQ
jgi:transposase